MLTKENYTLRAKAQEGKVEAHLLLTLGARAVRSYNCS